MGARTDEALFYRRFVDDVRRCAGGRASACVPEIERRVRVAMIAAPSVRERRWGRVVAAVSELLAAPQARDAQAAARLRAFVRENADLGRARDFSIGEVTFSSQAAGVLVTRSGRSYVLFDHHPSVAARPVAALDEIVPNGTRRLTEWLVYAFCAGAVAGAVWYSFVVHV